MSLAMLSSLFALLVMCNEDFLLGFLEEKVGAVVCE
jgi:hypothetical protein